MLSQLSYGQVVQVDCSGCLQTSQAKIYYISSEVEYAPPVVFSRENSAKYVYRVKAVPDEPQHFHPGQPVYVTIERENNDG